MTIRFALMIVALTAATASGADPFFFIQASDPQFGMYTANRDFRHETANWEFVIANVNRLHPAFLVVTGDLTNGTANADQIAEYKRIDAKLDPSIHLYNAPGNHDLSNEPTTGTLSAYRKNFGPDYYSFREGPVYGIVLDSSLMKAPEHVRDEAAKQEAWLENELKTAAGAGIVPVIFQHIPFFLQSPDEPDQYSNIPAETRLRVLAMLKRYGVRYVFAGHYHRNAFGKDGDLEMITTAAAGRSVGSDPSGFRIAEVTAGPIVQKYYGLGSIPDAYPERKP
ncbi:MAG TPA: metallophosphoesterase [Bryobacteraceae bacterium]|nr:metallophosphoesterase [Bryobacteraceae bacterium]